MIVDIPRGGSCFEKRDLSAKYLVAGLAGGNAKYDRRKTPKVGMVPFTLLYVGLSLPVVMPSHTPITTQFHRLKRLLDTASLLDEII
jgi:hypothetical protein